MSGYWSDFLTIAVAHLLAAASPGPDLAIVLKQSLAGGRRIGIWTAWGVATAICLHVAYSLLGLGVALRGSPKVFTAVKCVGAAYLAWVGVQALRAKPASEPDLGGGVERDRVERSTPSPSTPSPSGAYRTGFLTNALNPKVTLFFLAIFTTLVRAGTPLGVRLLYGAWIPFATGMWFTLVATLLTRDAVRRRFLHYSFWIDRAMGGLFIVFAALLLFATV